MRVAPFIVALGLLPAAASFAADPAVKPTPRKPLSRAELRVCMDRERALDKQHDGLRHAQESLLASSASLSAEAIALASLLRGLDSSDEAAVNGYNQRNDARNLQVDAHNKRTEALNAAMAELQGSDADYMAQCVSRPFLKADKEAILQETGRSPKPAGRVPEPARPRAPARDET